MESPNETESPQKRFVWLNDKEAQEILEKYHKVHEKHRGRTITLFPGQLWLHVSVVGYCLENIKED